MSLALTPGLVAALALFPPPTPPLETLDDPSTGIDADPGDAPIEPPRLVEPATVAPPVETPAVETPAVETPAVPEPSSPGPPAPPEADDAGSEPPVAETDPAPMPVDPAAGLPRDERGDPILGYSEVAEDPEAELEFADAPTASPELQYGSSSEVTYTVDYDDARHRPVPPTGQLDRESEADLGPRDDRKTGSPQRFAIELKMGPYLPNVDRGASGGPYEAIFGQTDDAGELVGPAKAGVFPALGFEWQFVNFGGPLSVGTSIGFFRDSATALLANPGPDENPRSEADTVKFTVVPVTLLFGYRFEMLADRFRVPLVPYAKAGLAYGFWESRDGSGQVSTNSAEERGRGGSIGWQANLGGMLRLDFIDYNASRELDTATGINHTYIFGEYQLSRLDGFGSGRRMSVGDDTWLAGLAVEF